MSGEAKSNLFGLGAATVMIGPAADLFNFHPATHSIGLVKNFELKADQQYQKLTQGVKNTMVYSVLTGNTLSASMEVYEYSSQNLAYGLGLNGSSYSATSVATTIATPMSTTGSPAATDNTLEVTSSVGFAVDDYVFVQIGTDDRVYVRKVTATATGVLTIDKTLPEAIPAGSIVKKVNVVFGGSKDDQPYMAAKIIGTLADGSEIALLIPKVKVSGFQLGFKTDNYGNLPFVFEVYDLVPTDANYADFANKGSVMIAQAG